MQHAGRCIVVAAVTAAAAVVVVVAVAAAAASRRDSPRTVTRAVLKAGKLKTKQRRAALQFD